MRCGQLFWPAHVILTCMLWKFAWIGHILHANPWKWHSRQFLRMATQKHYFLPKLPPWPFLNKWAPRQLATLRQAIIYYGDKTCQFWQLAWITKNLTAHNTNLQSCTKRHRNLFVSRLPLQFVHATSGCDVGDHKSLLCHMSIPPLRLVFQGWN